MSEIVSKRRAPTGAVLAVVVALVLVGCARSPSPELYVLDRLPQPAVAGEARGVSVGVVPVELPQYLDRPQIVTRDGANRLDASQAHVWAEPLAASATRVLIAGIGAALESNRVYRLPLRTRDALDWRVAVDVSHFDGVLGETAVLAARWSLYRDDEQSPRITRTAVIEQRTAGADHAALVAALNAALERLGADVAAAIAAAAP